MLYAVKEQQHATLQDRGVVVRLDGMHEGAYSYSYIEFAQCAQHISSKDNLTRVGVALCVTDGVLSCCLVRVSCHGGWRTGALNSAGAGAPVGGLHRYNNPTGNPGIIPYRAFYIQGAMMHFTESPFMDSCPHPLPQVPRAVSSRGRCGTGVAGMQSTAVARMKGDVSLNKIVGHLAATEHEPSSRHKHTAEGTTRIISYQVLCLLGAKSWQ